jgi:hypothetical protein
LQGASVELDIDQMCTGCTGPHVHISSTRQAVGFAHQSQQCTSASCRGIWSTRADGVLCAYTAHVSCCKSHLLQYEANGHQPHNSWGCKLHQQRRELAAETSHTLAGLRQQTVDSYQQHEHVCVPVACSMRPKDSGPRKPPALPTLLTAARLTASVPGAAAM